MRKTVVSIVMLLFFITGINAQNIVKGIVLDSDSEEPLKNASVTIKNENVKTFKTNENGVFILEKLTNGNYLLEIRFIGYETQNFPIELTGKTIDLGTILLYKDITEEEDLSTVTLTDELNDDTSAADNISGLLQASQDIYLRTAAFEFSPSFFRIRGLDSENGKVLINGIEKTTVE